MKTIQTLIPDIYKLMESKNGWFTDDLATDFGIRVGKRLQVQLSENKPRNSLRLSQMGPKCPKAIWASVHASGEAEKLPAWAEIKYSYGHIIEELIITLAKAAGHEVTGEQDELVVDGIAGHRDCVIDGCIVDVKSAASRSFEKFKSGTIGQDDSFGYLDQLDGYLCGSLEDPLVRVKDRAYLLAVDKQLGHLCLYEHKFREDHIRRRIAEYKEIVAQPEPPDCQCMSVKDGESGNLRLDLKASYNNFKYFCNPKIRTFLYADGPHYLTKVVKRPQPHIVEVNRYGKAIY